MADTPLPELAPTPARPSSTQSAAKPISQEDLSRTLQPPQARMDAPAREGKGPPQPKERGPALPDWKAKIREKVLAPEGGEKPPTGEKPPEKPEEKPEPKATETPPAKTGEKTTPKETAKPATPPPDGDPAPEMTIAELEEAANDPHAKPRDATRWRKLLYERRQAVTRAEAAETKLKETEAKLSQPQTSEELTKLREEHAKASDELSKYRRRFEIDTDPEFKTKYDEPAAHAEASIEATFKKHNLGASTLEAIKAEGGFAAFSRSTKTFPVTIVGADGEKTIVNKTAAELSRDWLNALPVADAEMIKQAVGRQQLLGEEKKQAVEKAVAGAREYFDSRSAAAKKAEEEQQQTQKQLAEAHAKWVKETTDSADWMKVEDVPSDATAAQKKEIEARNEFNRQLRSRVASVPKSAEEFHELIYDAAHAHHLRREIGARDERIKHLEAQLAKVKEGTRTTNRGGSLLAEKPGEKKEEKPDIKNPEADWKAGFSRNMRARVSGASAEE
jgi:hypothetical protein